MFSHPADNYGKNSVLDLSFISREIVVNNGYTPPPFYAIKRIKLIDNLVCRFDSYLLTQ